MRGRVDNRTLFSTQAVIKKKKRSSGTSKLLDGVLTSAVQEEIGSSVRPREPMTRGSHRPLLLKATQTKDFSFLESIFLSMWFC